MGGVLWGQSIDEASTAAFSMNMHVGADVEALSTIRVSTHPQAPHPTQLRGTLCLALYNRKARPGQGKGHRLLRRIVGKRREDLEGGKVSGLS